MPTKRSETMSSESLVGLANLPEERLAHIVRRLARAFQRELETRLKTEDVNFGFWVYLRILWREEGLSQRELSRRAGLTEPTTHTLLNKMEQKGLIERVPFSEGKRRTVVRLSPRGRALQDLLEPMATDVNSKAEQDLTAEEVQLFRRIALKMLANLDAPARPGS